MNEATFEIVKIIVSAVVAIIVVLVTKVAIPYIETLKMTAEQELIFTEMLKAVKAAEQTIKESKQGKAKRAQVIAYITQWLNDKKINITEEQVSNLLESCVFDINNPDKKEDDKV